MKLTLTTMLTTILTIALAILLAAVAAMAQPALLNVQGALTNADGTLVDDGIYNITFRIYDIPIGGMPLWQEVQNVDVSGSIFNTVLGYINSLSLPFDDIYYLGVEIAGDPEMFPRITLTSVPYAFNVVPGKVVKELNGLTDFVNLVPGANISITPSGQDIIISGTGGGADSDWTIMGPDQYSAVPGNVGIGIAAPAEKLHVTNGNIGIGNPGAQSNYLNSYHLGGGFPSRFGGDHGSSGGEIEMYTEDGNRYTFIEPDIDGEGGFLQVYSGNYFGGFWVDGNWSGEPDDGPVVNITGNLTGTIFNTNLAGDASVNLPVDAVGAEEILDEPGAAANKAPSFTIINPSLTTITSRTITVPTDGYVLALAQGEIELGHTSGNFTYARFGISQSSSSLPVSQDFGPELPPNAAAGTYLFPTSPHGIFPVSAGSQTFYLIADRSTSGTVGVWDSQLTLVFIPTMYGEVVGTLSVEKAPSGQVNDGTTAEPLSAGDIAAERDASIRANQGRIDAELAQMRSELEALRNQLAKLNEPR